MEWTAVMVQVQSVNEKKPKTIKEKKDNKEEKNEEAEQRLPLVSAAPSAIPAADGRCPLPPIPEVDDEREPESPAGSSQSLGYVAVPIIQPNETEAGAAVAAPHGAAPVTTTTNNGRNNGGRRIVRVNTRTRNNLVTSRRLLIQCLTQDVKHREQEIKMEREQLEMKKKIRESPRWVGRVVGFCALVVLCVLVVSALVKLILYYNTS